MKRNINLATVFLLAALPLAAISAESMSPVPADRPTTPITPAAPAAKEEPAPLFDRLDSNKDRYLSKAEAKRSTQVMDRFKELDIDRDGKVSADEFKKGMQPKL